MSESLGSIILHHVTNDLNYKYFDLHLFGYDISITKHVIMLWIAASITVCLALYGTRRYRISEDAEPKGLSHLYEILLNFIKNDIVIPNIGSSYGLFWPPLITTYFLFILTCNFLGLIPLFDLLPGGSSTVTGNFNTTAGLATITFFAIIIAGTMKHGFFGYWRNMIPSGVPGPVLIILIPIEILGMFLLINNLNRNDYNLAIKYISPLLLFVLIYSYGNPSLLIHIKKTLSNQNYSLNKAIYEKDNELDNILNLIKPNDVPVLVVGKGRYLNYLHPKNYIDQE